jgi:hypothetical protein
MPIHRRDSRADLSSIWSVDCSGILRAGILGYLEFFFSLIDLLGEPTLYASFAQVTTDGILPHSISKRDDGTRLSLKLRPSVSGIVGKRGPKPKSPDVLK